MLPVLPREAKLPRLNMNRPIRESVGMTNAATEGRAADAVLRWNEQRYRTLFDLGPVPTR